LALGLGIGIALPDRRMSTLDKKILLPEAAVGEQDTEKLLLERLESSKSEDDYFRWLLFVVGYYRGLEKTGAATALLRQFIATSQSDERRAHCHLTLGQIATDEQRFEGALDHFETALAFNPKKKKIAYVLHNNAGYCLNMLGSYTEGERHCRQAIEINWTRASGYRNLGLSLKGQGNIVGAVWALVEAAKLDISDERSRVLLRTLMAQNPELAVRCPWVVEGLLSDGLAESTPQN
jgi:tetratricopeptide (TPR) repeat protein